MGELGEWEPPVQPKISLMRIQKVIPETSNNKSMLEDTSVLNIESKEYNESIVDRK